MKNSSEIQTALRKCLDEDGLSCTEFAHVLGVAPATVTRWLNGKTKQIKPRIWKKLYPAIAHCLKKEPGKYLTTPAARVAGHRRLPVLSTAAAPGYEPALEPLETYLADNADETEIFRDAEEGWFALRIETDSMAPAYPAGTLMLVAGDRFPEPEDLVVARLADREEVMVKRYHRENNTVTLAAVNPDGRSVKIDTAREPGRIMWLRPIARIRIDLKYGAQEHRRA